MPETRQDFTQHATFWDAKLCALIPFPNLSSYVVSFLQGLAKHRKRDADQPIPLLSCSSGPFEEAVAIGNIREPTTV